MLYMSKYVVVMIINLKFLYINIFVYIWLVKEKVDVLWRFVIGGGLKLFILVEVEFLSGMGDRFIFRVMI